MPKKYAVVADVSPSEQLGQGDEEVKVMALVFGLNDPLSFERVGPDFPDPSKKFTLKKWSGSSRAYKEGFLAHADLLRTTGNVVFGSLVANERGIRVVGEVFFQSHMGALPAPTDYNKKGRPRIRVGQYKVDGLTVGPYSVLQDDLAILGWYGEALAGVVAALDQLNGEPTELDVIVDRLPNDHGVDHVNKATVLKELIRRATNGRAKVVGVPARTDTLQRDLLVDNLAGLGREIELGSRIARRCPPKLFGLQRRDIHPPT